MSIRRQSDRRQEEVRLFPSRNSFPPVWRHSVYPLSVDSASLALGLTPSASIESEHGADI